MKCFTCEYEETRVLETRVNRFGWIRRRRSCPECGERFNTYEIPEWCVDMTEANKENMND